MVYYALLFFTYFVFSVSLILSGLIFPITLVVSILYTVYFYYIVKMWDNYIDTIVIELTTEKEKSKFRGFMVAGFFLLIEATIYIYYSSLNQFDEIEILENFVIPFFSHFL